MKGDFSRSTFRPSRHYSAVLQQQGRVSLDADFNEHTEIDRRRLRTLARDVIGACGGPRDAAGFAIIVDADGRLVIGAGRYYVDGLQVENERDCPIDRQPHLPTAVAALAAAASSGGRDILYLDVWERTITHLEDEGLLDPALGGVDTSVREKAIWQVRFGRSAPGEIECEPQSVRAERATLDVRSGAAGYVGPENQLYRVEIHSVGQGGGASFKWSRDNASLVLPLVAIDRDLLTLADSPAEAADRLAPGDWLELLDDALELEGEAGQLVQIVAIDRAAMSVAMATEAARLADTDSGVDGSLHPKVRRWAGIGGPAPETRAGPWIALENGIEVALGGGDPQPGDYWLIPARPADSSVEWPGGPRPAQRIEHRCCPLAVVELDPAASTWLVVEDRRRLFAPLTG